jgi:hypothetical protein
MRPLPLQCFDIGARELGGVARTLDEGPFGPRARANGCEIPQGHTGGAGTRPQHGKPDAAFP